VPGGEGGGEEKRGTVTMHTFRPRHECNSSKGIALDSVVLVFQHAIACLAVFFPTIRDWVCVSRGY
jgi:hypothetical protein